VNGSDDLKKNLNAETRSRGENQRPTTEARRHGEIRRSSDFPDHPITRSTFALALINNAIRTFHSALREIFDESAYDRFLLRTHASRTAASYRDFTRERDAAMLEKPRCC
jgi:hypothetical protein